MGNNGSSLYHECIINDDAYTLPKNFKNAVEYDKGGQATVLKATDKNTKQKVAIKRISLICPDTGAISVSSTKNAYRELALLGLVKHPNIINLLHAYTPDPTIDTFKDLYLVMPFITNTLQARLRPSNEPFTDAEILKFIYGILNGLDYLHKFEIVHRDLKPHNIGITENGDPIIFDFGLARLNTVNSITNGAGTWVYMAPEIFIGIKCPGHVVKADIWSLGCIWIEMINRRRFVTNIKYSFEYWIKLLELLGTPDDGFMNKIPEFLRSLFAKSLKVDEAKPWTELIPTKNFCESVRSNEEHINAVRTIIFNMLKYDPEKRPSSQDLISQFEQNNWCNNKTTFDNLTGVEEFKRICHKAKNDGALWRKLLFERMGYCTTLLKFPLHKACFHNNVDELRQLLNTTKSSLNAKDSGGDTPLHIAIVYNYIEIARLLLDNGANANAKNSDEDAPLHFAILYGSIEIVRLLLEHGANVNAKNSDGMTPLYFATKRKNIEIVLLLLKHGADLNATNDYGITPLCYAVRKHYIEIVRLLLEHGANVNARGSYDMTPLHYAISHNSIEIARLLLENGADVNAINHEQESSSESTISI